MSYQSFSKIWCVIFISARSLLFQSLTLLIFHIIIIRFQSINQLMHLWTFFQFFSLGCYKIAKQSNFLSLFYQYIKLYCRKLSAQNKKIKIQINKWNRDVFESFFDPTSALTYQIFDYLAVHSQPFFKN